MDNFTIKKVADAYAELGSVRKTAKALGLCRETVIKSLVTYGVYPMGKCADANRLRIAGWSKEAICEELGIHPRTYALHKGQLSDRQQPQNGKRAANCRMQTAQGGSGGGRP